MVLEYRLDWELDKPFGKAAPDVNHRHFKNPNGVPSFSLGLLAKRATLGNRELKPLFRHSPRLEGE